jgi:excisionase family DNA binding protein
MWQGRHAGAFINPQTDVAMSDSIRLPRLLSERESAAALGVSIETLRRLRRAGAITFTRIGGRIRYTEDHLLAYIEKETRACRENPQTDPARSGISGSADGPTPPPGAAPGSIHNLDRQSAHRLAQRIFRKRS